MCYHVTYYLLPALFLQPLLVINLIIKLLNKSH